MTISEKNYNDALKRAKEIYDLPTSTIITRNLFEQVFPELKESEDDRIRKEIVQSIKDNMCVIHKDKCLAWLDKKSETFTQKDVDDAYLKGISDAKNELEKQGKKSNIPQDTEDDLRRQSTTQVLEYARSLDAYNQYGKEDIDKDIDWLEKQGEKVDAIENFDTEFEKQVSHLIASAINKEHEYNRGYVKWAADALLNYAKHELKKLGEQSHYNPYKATIESIAVMVEKYADGDFEDFYDNVAVKCHDAIEYDKTWGKQFEQKPADKVEPKFKVGDWIINNDKRIAVPTQILETERHGYDTSRGYISFDKVKTDYHPWVIQDAKDGDVLVTKNKNIFIFKSISDCTIYDYCGLYFGKFMEISAAVNGYAAVQLPIDYVPATKEQRDLLFQNMKEAGYEWDDEKKELKKVEQKLAWSEEDEKMLDEIIKHVRNYQKIVNPANETGESDLTIWLRSLKPNHWKPSKEQMKALNTAVAVFRGLQGTYPIKDIESLYNDLKNL